MILLTIILYYLLYYFIILFKLIDANKQLGPWFTK